MTFDDLADAIGVSRSMAVKLERGEREMTLEYLTKLAEAFNVSVSEMVGEAKPVRPRHITEWHDDDGAVLWWHDGEAPWVGTPLDVGREVLVTLTLVGESHNYRHYIGGWPGYHKWWTPLPLWPDIASLAEPLGRKEGGSDEPS